MCVYLCMFLFISMCACMHKYICVASWKMRRKTLKVNLRYLGVSKNRFIFSNFFSDMSLLRSYIVCKYQVKSVHLCFELKRCSKNVFSLYKQIIFLTLALNFLGICKFAQDKNSF